MVEIVGCVNLSKQTVTRANWLGAVSVIVGLALAILAQTAAAHLNTNSLYFFAPGVSLAGIGFITLVIANCCRKEHSEKSKKNPPPPDSSDDKAGSAVGGLWSDDDDDLDLFAPAPSKKDGKPQTELERALALSRGMLAPSIISQGYVIQTGSYNGVKPNDKVHPPRDVAGVYQQIPGERKQDSAQCAWLNENYYYQVVEGKGDCFYIALASGFLHHMVATQDFDGARAMVDACTDNVTPELKQTALDIIRDVKDKDSLIEFLLAKGCVNKLVRYFRAVAANMTGVQAVTTRNRYAEQAEVVAMTERFGAGWCITPEHESWEHLQKTKGVMRDELGNFLIIARPNHYDLLIPKRTIGQIGITEDTPF